MDSSGKRNPFLLFQSFYPVEPLTCLLLVASVVQYKEKDIPLRMPI